MVARFKRPFAALTALVDVEQYVRFPVGKELSKCLTDAGNEIKLVIDHPNYCAEAKLAPETRWSFAEDREA